MTDPVRTHGAIRARWSEPERARHYRAGRFERERAAGRDPRHLAALLSSRGFRGTLLDVPCGTGRLQPELARLATDYVGVDASLAMLGECPPTARTVAADALALPFRDGAFEAVVACRLFHHLAEPEARIALARELARVSARLVAGTYWDAASWHALRRRLGLRRDASTRAAIPRARFAAELEAAGLRPVSWSHSFRFVSQQAYFVAETR